MPRVGLATASELPDLDDDDRPLLGLLSDRGIEARPVVWDDPDVAWERFDLVVLRSTWDYAPRRPEFLAWARHVDGVARLANPAQVVAWNTDKRYLSELAARDVPIVPTRWVEPGGALDLPPIEVVVKPTVSAGSKDTARYAPEEHDAARAHLARLHDDGRVAMVQPYVASVDRRGETALLHLGGAYSHAIRKDAMLTGDREDTGLYVEETITPTEPDGAERDVAERTLEALPFPRSALAYARIDLVATDDGPCVLEVELTEPSLFLAHAEGAATRFADVIAAALS